MAEVTADRWEADAATSAYLASLPGPSDDLLAALDAEPTTTDDLTVDCDEREEWRDNSCE